MNDNESDEVEWLTLLLTLTLTELYWLLKSIVNYWPNQRSNYTFSFHCVSRGWKRWRAHSRHLSVMDLLMASVKIDYVMHTYIRLEFKHLLKWTNRTTGSSTSVGSDISQTPLATNNILLPMGKDWPSAWWLLNGILFPTRWPIIILVDGRFQLICFTQGFQFGFRHTESVE